MSERVLITGINGFIGSPLAEQERSAGRTVLGFSRRHGGDITNRQSLETTIRDYKPTHIYNLAALSNPVECDRDPNLAFKINGGGTQNVIDSSQGAKVFQALSSHQYGFNPPNLITERTPFNPQTVYARSKDYAREAVEVARKGGINVGFGVIFGAEGAGREDKYLFGRLASGIVHSLVTGEKIMIGDLNYRKDLLDIEDVARAMRLMMAQPKVPNLLIASGVARSVQEFLEVGFDSLNVKNWQERVELDAGYDCRKQQPVYVGDPKGLAQLGFSPQVSFENLVARMVGYHAEKSGLSRKTRQFSYAK